MKRIAISCISVILGICLLGAAGWGVFNYISLSYKYISLEQTIRQQEDEIYSLSIQKIDLAEELANETKRANELQYQYSYLQTQYSDLQRQLEAATFKVGKDMLVKPTEARGVDCDDSALYMYYYFTNMGYEVKIIAGNLDLVGESFLQCNHVWVVVISGGDDYAYDWGHYYTDAQHYEGYVITETELVSAVLEDID
jgi:hypothetical protein